MKTRMAGLLVAAVATSTPSAHSFAEELTGHDVARRIEDRDRGRDGRVEMEMRLYDHRGRETVRRLTVLTLREESIDHLLLRFTFPGDIRETGLLSIEQPDGDNDQFLYLPALGRSRRISSGERQDPFVGSDFTYEEISGRRLDDYNYKLLGEESLDGRPVYVLESTAKESNAKHARSVSWVDTERLMILRAEIFDSNGELIKEFTSARIEEIDGVWTPREQTMRTPREDTSTVLAITQASFNTGLPARVFTRNTLERGGELR